MAARCFTPEEFAGRSTFAEIRQLYPDYSDLKDHELLSFVSRTYYSEVPFAEFVRLIGMATTAQDVARLRWAMPDTEEQQ